jgi:3-methyladenine DNA glycosylase AlkD
VTVEMTGLLTAAEFVQQLLTYQSDEELNKIRRYFKPGEADDFIGVRMGDVFDLAKSFIDLPPPEIERLLDSPLHEARAGGLSVMSKQAARKTTPASRRAELFELYLRRHDRINNWDLVDLAAPTVVGGYLFDKPRDVLYSLARSEDPWERRTAIFSTLTFVRKGDVVDTFAIAGILVADTDDLVQKPTRGMLREAGKKDEPILLAFLDKHAATMPRVMLRYAVERLDPAQRKHYLAAACG